LRLPHKRGVVSGETSLIGRLVATSIRFPLIVLLRAVAFTAVALVYAARHFRPIPPN
jgi:hypothetical protein